MQNNGVGILSNPVGLLLTISLESLGVIINDFRLDENERYKTIYASIMNKIDMDEFESDTNKIINRIKQYVPNIDITFDDLTIYGYSTDKFAKYVKDILEYIYGDKVCLKYIIRNDFVWRHSDAEEVYNNYINKLNIIKASEFNII